METRIKSLEWWKSLPKEKQIETIDKWKLVTEDRRKNWEFELITTSSSTIEFICKELNIFP
jgi:hypothetical protein